jgi:hypothetical protein
MGMGDWWVQRCLDCYYKSEFLPDQCEVTNLQLSSPSNIPGIPTRSSGIPNSASASMLSGCSRASRDANPGFVYCPLARPVFGMSKSLGGLGGGGSALEYRIRAM